MDLVGTIAENAVDENEAVKKIMRGLQQCGSRKC